MSPTRATLIVAAASLGTLLGCKLEPETPELRYSLSDKVLNDPDGEEYASDSIAQDQLRGALEMLFGTPSNPGFLLTEDMLDEGFDPNFGSDELSEAEWEALIADNSDRFADDIAHIEAGEFDDVRLPREALSLLSYWEETMDEIADLEQALADAEAGGEDEDGDPLDAEGAQADLDEAIAAVKADWPEELRNYYPSLRDSSEMFRTQCIHCHGVEGGGNGPTAEYLKPLPRDYRNGIFKFTSVANKARPTRSDLFRVLARGIYTTSMPSFRRFSDAQLHGLVDYVRLLSIRGRVEILGALDYDIDSGGITMESVLTAYADEWEEWLGAGENVIAYEGDVPAPDDIVPGTNRTMIEHGRELFKDESSANCASCHGTNYRGNGPSSKERDPETGEMVQITDDWGNPIEPRDLTRGIFRFGRRPIDVFRRVHAGINGTPMPAQTTLTDAEGNRLLSDDDLWAITHFVRSLSTHEQVVATQDEEAGH
ncbi:MAG: cytochrome c [Planctomycetota bacterium]